MRFGQSLSAVVVYDFEVGELQSLRAGRFFEFIRPGKPVENAFIESFNGQLRDDCLNAHPRADSTRAS